MLAGMFNLLGAMVKEGLSSSTLRCPPCARLDLAVHGQIFTSPRSVTGDMEGDVKIVHPTVANPIGHGLLSSWSSGTGMLAGESMRQRITQGSRGLCKAA